MTMGTDRNEHYILHIYRRDHKAINANLVGILEEPISGQQWRFRTARELGHLLNVQGLEQHDASQPKEGDSRE